MNIRNDQNDQTKTIARLTILKSMLQWGHWKFISWKKPPLKIEEAPTPHRWQNSPRGKTDYNTVFVVHRTIVRNIASCETVRITAFRNPTQLIWWKTYLPVAITVEVFYCLNGSISHQMTRIAHHSPFIMFPPSPELGWDTNYELWIMNHIFAYLYNLSWVDGEY